MTKRKPAHRPRLAPRPSDLIEEYLRATGASRSGVPVSDIHHPVNSPKHYKLEDGTELIDHLRSVLGREGFTAYLEGTAIAYIARAQQKNGREDYLKAAWYCNRLADEASKPREPGAAQ